MKHSLYTTILLLSCVTLHCMEDNLIKNGWQNISCAAIETCLIRNYKKYVEHNLEKYKTTHFTSQNIVTIDNMCLTLTGRKDRSCLYNTCDEQKNRFPHIAIQKFDLPVLQWFVSQGYIYYPKNTENKGFIELCIDHLSPRNSISAEQKKIAYNMLELLTTTYDGQLALSLRKPIVEKLLTLQLEYKKEHFTQRLPDHFFTRFLTQGPDKTAPLDLSALYQQTIDHETGNTFTHIAIEQGESNELYQLIQKTYASCAKNKTDETPIDMALRLFQIFTQHPKVEEIISVIPRPFKNTRCCLFMLLNYAKKQQGITFFNQCCDKHTITI